MTSTLYDALTLEIERADVLTGHLATRLFDLSAGDDSRELYALSLVAESIRARHALIVEHAMKLLKSGGAR